MAEIVTNNIHADSIYATDEYVGNLVVNGAARFANPIYAEINGSSDINHVTTGTISNGAYVMFSNGTNLFRVQYSDLIADLSSKVSITFADSEGVGY